MKLYITYQLAFILIAFFNLVSAERLCCPHFKFRACGCLQSYIIGDGKSVWNQDKSDLFCYTTKSCHLHLQCIFPTSILVSHWSTPLQSQIALKHCWKMYFIIQIITVKECSFTFLLIFGFKIIGKVMCHAGINFTV